MTTTNFVKRSHPGACGRIPSNSASSHASYSRFILSKRIEAGRGQKEFMTPKVKENKEFARWLRDWIKVIQGNRAPVEHTPPEKTASAEGQEHSDDTHLFGPRRRAAFGRYAA